MSVWHIHDLDSAESADSLTRCLHLPDRIIEAPGGEETWQYTEGMDGDPFVFCLFVLFEQIAVGALIETWGGGVLIIPYLPPS